MAAKDLAKRIARRARTRLAPASDLLELPVLQEGLRAVAPPDARELSVDAYVPADERIGTGFDLHEQEQVDRVSRWRGVHDDLFTKLRSDPRINALAMGSDHLHNRQYPTPDAEVYAAMISDYRPRQIVEIGAGYSSAVARKTIDHLGLACGLTIVDPQPRAEVSDQADRILRRRIEEVDTDSLELDARMLLFIDSSHVVRARGDIPRIFHRLIPALPEGTLVHVHDIFIPFDYPEAYRLRLYGEQYVLWALLTNAPAYRIALATHFMAREHTALMQEVFGSIVGRDPLYFGASFWFSVEGHAP